MHDPEVKFRKIDIKNAYINEDMRREVYTWMPPGYVVFVYKGQVVFRRLEPGEKQPRLAVRLQKALYGGMECGRIFWEEYIDWHLEDGFQLIHEDRCYLHRRDESGWIKFSFHVDDNAIAYKGEETYQSYLGRLRGKFDVKEGPLTSHLHINYHFEGEGPERVVRVEQEAQIVKMLKEFGMENCNPVKTPVPSGAMLNEEDCKTPHEGEFDMEALVGHANYINLCTRPDIGQVLKPLARYTTNFGKRHVEWAKYLLRYLRGTQAQCLVYRAGFPMYAQIFTDASHASEPDTRRSITSVVVKIGGNTVYWKSSFTSIVCHSSCESELMALDVGATILEMVRWLVEAIGMHLDYNSNNCRSR